MNVVFLVQNIVPYHHARFEKFASEFDGEVHVIQMTNRDFFASLEVEVQQSNYKLYSLFLNTEVESIQTEDLRFKLDETLKIINPDCICVSGWGLRIGLVMLLYALKKNLPSVILADSTEYDERRVWWKESIKSVLVKSSASALVAGAPHQSYIELLGMNSDHVFQGYDVVDNVHFSRYSFQPSKELMEQLKLPYFIACSRFGEKKNIPRLINAYVLYKNECFKKGKEPYKLLIAGDGEQRKTIEQIIVDMQVLDSVKLLGAVDYNSLPSLYQNAEAFVHASTTEQWGLVVNEAMAAGAPVLISNRCGSAPDLVHEGKNGFQFDPYDENQISQCLMKFHTLSDVEKKTFSENSQMIISKWGTKRFSDGLTKAINKAVQVGAKKNTLFSRTLITVLLRRAWQ